MINIHIPSHSHIKLYLLLEHCQTVEAGAQTGLSA